MFLDLCCILEESSQLIVLFYIITVAPAHGYTHAHKYTINTELPFYAQDELYRPVDLKVRKSYKGGSGSGTQFLLLWRLRVWHVKPQQWTSHPLGRMWNWVLGASTGKGMGHVQPPLHVPSSPGRTQKWHGISWCHWAGCYGSGPKWNGTRLSAPLTEVFWLNLVEQYGLNSILNRRLEGLHLLLPPPPTHAPLRFHLLFQPFTPPFH